MKNIHIARIALLLVAPALTKDQDSAGRKLAHDQIRQKMAVYFQASSRPNIPPRKEWTPSDEGQISVLLDTELEKAEHQANGLQVLAVLDCEGEVDNLKPNDLDLALKIQVAWAEGFYSEAEKISRNTPLERLMKTLDRERLGRAKPNEPSSAMILQQDDFSIVHVYLTWAPFRDAVLNDSVRKILQDDDYICHAILPSGFERSWLTGAHGPAELWDEKWDTAWNTGNFELVCSLLKVIPQYHPNGLSSVQKDALLKRQNTDWGLPYLWVKKSNEDDPKGIFSEEFTDRIHAARYLHDGRDTEAESILARVATNPRDRYELSLLREKIGSETALKGIVDQGNSLLEDPRVSGWTLDQAKVRISNAKAKLDQIAIDRAAAKAEATRQIEVARQAEAARQAEIVRQEAERKIAAQKAVARAEAANRSRAASLDAEREAARNAAGQYLPVAAPGDSQALVDLGLNQIADNEDAAGASNLLSAAEQGNINAQMAIGACYDRGVGVKRNRSEAIKWFRICVARAEAAVGNSWDDDHIRKVAGNAAKKLKLMGVE